VRDVTARAPVRIDFGGGWTDVPPYPQEEGGCVCNLAIARYATARLAERGVGLHVDAHDEDQALPRAALEHAGISSVSLHLRNDFPRGAGLGGSSAAGVAIQAALAAWRGETAGATSLAERSRAVETEGLRVPGGSQDHYAAALGGALELRFGAGVEARHIALSPARRSELERRCTRMIALMEVAAARAMRPLLGQGQLSVGVSLSVKHTAATAVGSRVRAVATYLRTEAKLMHFKVEAFDESGSIIGPMAFDLQVDEPDLVTGAERRRRDQFQAERL